MGAILDRVARAISPIGLIPRGGFHPDDGDEVPALPAGGGAATVVLAGNAGPAMWAAFSNDVPEPAGDHPLDDWLGPRLRQAAASLGAHLVLPREGPPFAPIQRWAARAEPVFPSPIGIFIHADYGLWHAWRAAFLFAEAADLPPRDERPSPCASCAGRPCLTACPVDAFAPDGFDAERCAGHISATAGADCLALGCRARHACPVGQEYAYAPDQAAFHMAKFSAAMAADRSERR